MLSPVTGVQIVQRARLYLCTPFVSGGRNEFGLDCGGLIIRVTHDLGLTTFDVPNYSLSFDCGQVERHLEPLCDWVEEVQPGDFLLFSLVRGCQHLAIATGEGGIIHAWDVPSVRAVVETPLDVWWRERLLSMWRFRGLA